MSFEAKLQEYARLLVEVGVNIQKGQRLVLRSPVECAPFARLCAAAAYAAGCKEVVMDWRDDFMTRQKYLYADNEIFDAVPEWNKHFFNDYAEEGAALLAISASDPENLKGVDSDRLIRATRSSSEALKPFYRLQMSNGIPWCIASMPIPSWAEKVFPGKEDAVERLWDAIFAAVRITGDGTAVAKWKGHLAVKRQFSPWYRFVGVFVEKGKWKRLLRHPILACVMFFERFAVGVVYLKNKGVASE